MRTQRHVHNHLNSSPRLSHSLDNWLGVGQLGKLPRCPTPSALPRPFWSRLPQRPFGRPLERNVGYSSPSLGGGAAGKAGRSGPGRGWSPCGRPTPTSHSPARPPGSGYSWQLSGWAASLMGAVE